MTDYEVVTVKLIPKASAALLEAATLTGLSRTDTINRALQLYGFVEQVYAEGGNVCIQRPGGAMERLEYG